MKNKLLPASFLGIFVGWSVFKSLDNLLDYTSSRAVVLQSELTEQVYQNANNAIDKAAQGDYKMGLACALATGFCITSVVYHATKKRE